jgi:hypothetical protein
MGRFGNPKRASIVPSKGAENMYFAPETLTQIQQKLGTVSRRTDDLFLRIARFQFQNEQAHEYAYHGFSRRLGTVRRCVENIFQLIPADTEKVPPKDTLYDAQINLQAFMANVYGCTDNLGWVWVYEKGLLGRINRQEVGLRKKHTKVRASFRSDFKTYLEEMDDWFDYLTDYRDALGHRVPLYVPPGGVRSKDQAEYQELNSRMMQALNRGDYEEYERLEVQLNELPIFQPLMIHSFKEAVAPVAFHAQVLVDFATIEELTGKFFDELSL